MLHALSKPLTRRFAVRAAGSFCAQCGCHLCHLPQVQLIRSLLAQSTKRLLTNFFQLQAHGSNIWMCAHRSHSLICPFGQRIRPQQVRLPPIVFTDFSVFVIGASCVTRCSSWGFPKGKLSRNESEIDCAVCQIRSSPRSFDAHAIHIIGRSEKY